MRHMKFYKIAAMEPQREAMSVEMVRHIKKGQWRPSQGTS